MIFLCQVRLFKLWSLEMEEPEEDAGSKKRFNIFVLRAIKVELQRKQ